MVVDHINYSGLNNLERNLRVCTAVENQRNRRAVGGSSQYKGVSYDKEHKKWEAGIGVKGRRIHIGLFEGEIGAARAYDRRARQLFGTFAYLNFPNESTNDP
jgi:AP2 domain